MEKHTLEQVKLFAHLDQAQRLEEITLEANIITSRVAQMFGAKKK
jgi:hypothetical protein